MNKIKNYDWKKNKKMKATERQKRFASLFVSSKVTSGNQYQSAIKAGFSHNTAIKGSIDILGKPIVQELIQKELDKINFNDELVLTNHKQAVVQNKDMSSKLKGVELYYKITGRLVDRREVKRLSVTIKSGDVSDSAIKALKYYEDQLKKPI